MENIDYLSTNGLTITTDLFVHGFVLFAILTAFFLLYVSKITDQNMSNELGNLVTTNLTSQLTDYKKKYGTNVTDALKVIPYDTLKEKYTTPDVYRTNNNNWLKKSLIISNVFSFVIVVIIIVLLNFICKKNIDIPEIMKIILITFVCVGGVEFLFFKKVAVNYIPTPPSFMVTSIMNDVKKNFS